MLPYSSDPEALFASRSWFLQPAQKGGKSFFPAPCVAAHPGAHAT